MERFVPDSPRRWLGFEALRVGKLAEARLLEPFAMVWIKLSIAHGREFAFAVVRR